MFESKHEILTDRVHKYTVRQHGESISFQGAIGLWQRDETFRAFFNSLLADSPFSAFRWETPPISKSTVSRDFEFVLLDAPELIRAPDRGTFANQIAAADKNGIAVFENLGRDAVLVVPSPHGECSYDQLANFVRTAPSTQMHALWQDVGRAVDKRLSDSPLWLNTAGGGVAWLHVRLDSVPKYYAYSPYKTFA